MGRGLVSRHVKLSNHISIPYINLAKEALRPMPRTGTVFFHCWAHLAAIIFCLRRTRFSYVADDRGPESTLIRGGGTFTLPELHNWGGSPPVPPH